MNFIKKALIDFVLCLLFLVLAAFLAVPVKIANPDCVTCGVTAAATYWISFVIALQPVLWVVGLRVIHRFSVWLTAVSSGAITYFLMEYIGAYLLSVGNPIGLRIGYFANFAFDLVALLVSIYGVKLVKQKFIEPPNKSSDREAVVNAPS